MILREYSNPRAQGQAASKGIKPQLAPPHNLEYEKTMFPLVLLSKKRYVGLLYEDDPDAKPKQKSMGIALKRRDYAPIVKHVCHVSLLCEIVHESIRDACEPDVHLYTSHRCTAA